MKSPYKRLYSEANRQVPLPDGLVEKTVTAMKKESFSLKKGSFPEAITPDPIRTKRLRRFGRLAIPSVAAVAALCLAVLLPFGLTGLPAGNSSAGNTVESASSAGSATEATASTPSTQSIRGEGTKTVMLAQPSLPDDSQKPEETPSLTQSLRQFALRTAAPALGSGTDNLVYSPASLYEALAMLAETTGGDTQTEILAALGTDSLSEAETAANALFRSCYYRSDTGRRAMANSLWLASGFPYREKPVEKLADTLYASVFHADLGTGEADDAIAAWINQNTGGKLGKQVSKTTPNTVLVLLNTLYFYAEWQDRFYEEMTSPAPFYTDGMSVEIDFMNSGIRSTEVLYADRYTAAFLPFKEQGRMVFILPKEGVSPEELLASPDELAPALDSPWSSPWQSQTVRFQVPKFSFTADLDLNETLKSLGIRSAFAANADFSPLSEDDLRLSRAQQVATVSIDEKGCEAAAFTHILTAGTAMPSEILEINLNRPFLFAIVSDDDLPLFIGVFRHPTP